MRGLYMLLFIFIYGFAKFLIILVMLFQFFSTALTGNTNIQLLKFSQNLAKYVYQIIIFLTYSSEQRPFPFSAWPNVADDNNEDGI